MPDGAASFKPTQSLCLEALEEREVPASFGGQRGLDIAFADVLPGDFQREYITSTGPGREGLVRIWSLSGVERMRFKPFPGFSGGVYIATGDVDGDGNVELICSTAPGTVGQVKVFGFRNGGRQLIASFTPFGPTYSGGVQIATGDVTGGPLFPTGVRPKEIIVGRESDSPTVKVFAVDGTVGQAFEIRSFQAYDSSYHGGVTVAAANIDIGRNTVLDPYDYNFAEIITGRASELPEVRVFDAQNPDVVMRASWMAFNLTNPAHRQGINVAAGSTDGQRGAEVYVGLRHGGVVRIFNGYNGGFYGAIRPYPSNYARSVNFFVNSSDDDFQDIYRIGTLVTVGGNGPYVQIPLIFPGGFLAPAGLNGSIPAA